MPIYQLAVAVDENGIFKWTQIPRFVDKCWEIHNHAHLITRSIQVSQIQTVDKRWSTGHLFIRFRFQFWGWTSPGPELEVTPAFNNDKLNLVNFLFTDSFVHYKQGKKDSFSNAAGKFLFTALIEYCCLHLSSNPSMAPFVNYSLLAKSARKLPSRFILSKQTHKTTHYQ